MRYLNKIAFINSASVKYAEIELNGNVHFIGTQGVGKSTLLRAILFFYNANKNKLGISREKKRFDDYYFQFQNSFIVYEVIKNDVPFCVLAYKVNGKVAFRFFNSEYKKEFFLDKDGRAFDSWEKTRDAFGPNIQYSKIISNYEEFRKIIYGDNKSLKPEFRKYALLESKQYQNIPRTIQNVLLNSNLEAKFIKDTIIKSINEEEFKIDISNYSTNHLKDFESQINDIKLWFHKNRKGQIVIRNQADKIIENLALINFVNRECKSLAINLLQRMTFLEEQKPLMWSKYNVENEALKKITTQKEDLKKGHLEKEQKVVSEITYIKKKLSEAKQKLQDYTDKNINEIINKVQNKDQLIVEQTALVNEKTLLNTGFAEIGFKYEALLSQANNQYQNTVNSNQGEILENKNKFNNSKEEINIRFEKSEQKLNHQKRTELELENELMLQLSSDENSLVKSKAELKYKPFFYTEILECENAEKEQRLKLTEVNAILVNSKNEITTLKKEWTLEESQIVRDSNFDLNTLQVQLENKKEQVSDLDLKLKGFDSSFYQWLNSNVDNWENSIGKVIDHESVLFNKQLDPKLINQTSSSLFGVEINLDEINKSVKSLQDFESDLLMVKKEIKTLEKQIDEANETKISKLKKLNIKFGKRNQVLKDTITENEYIIGQTNQTLKQIANTKLEWQNKATKDKSEQQIYLQEQLDLVLVNKKKSKDVIEKINKKFEKDLSKSAKSKQTEIEDVKSVIDKRINDIQSGLLKSKDELEEKIKRIEIQKNEDLKSKGADTDLLNIISVKLKDIDLKLEFIKQNERFVFDFEKDKRELFDLVPGLKQDRLAFKTKKQALSAEHDLELKEIDKLCEAQEKTVRVLSEKNRIYKQDLEEFDVFKKTEVYTLLFSNINEDNIITSDLSDTETAVQIISSLKEKYYSKQDKNKSLQLAVNAFNGQFNDQNIFSFKVKLTSDAEYLDFAIELKEFIEENKIEEYKNRVNERFAHIIQLIGNETSELISKEAEIEKIIKKINNDFLSRNFVQAIKMMEMRTLKSSNPIVMLLIKIKEFNEENGMTLGESNLFTVHDTNSQNSKAIDLLKQLMFELENQKQTYLSLSESFDLQFRIVENDNDSGWVEKLANVGSEGTDVLVKAMINILLLNVFKNTASKRFKDFKLHCMMDEIGRLHPNNVRGILQFANDRNILLINGSPTSQNAMDYRYTYKLSKDQSKSNNKKYNTSVRRLVKVTSNALPI